MQKLEEREKGSSVNASKKPDFIHLDDTIRFEVGHVGHDKVLGAYYQDFTTAIKNFERQQFGDFDEEGLPRENFGDRALYNPIYIAQFALMQHDFYLKNREQGHQVLFRKSLDWLLENSVRFKESIVWPSPKENKKYGLQKGWVSGMYQGQIISVLLRGYQKFGENVFLDAAATAFGYFQYGYDEGGVVRTDEKGYFWIEEYPSEEPSYVLNGFIYAILGIYDYYRVTADLEAKKYYDRSIKTIVDNLHRYDLFYWSRYDLLKKELVSSYYQINVHANLMEILYTLTELPVFKKYAVKWAKNYHNTLYRELLVPIIYRLQPRIRRLTHD